MPSDMRTVVGVVGASGGVGATTLAAALARRYAVVAGRSVLIDGDLFGGGIDVSIGLEHARGVRWRDLSRLRGRVDPRRLVEALPAAGNCAVLSAGRGPRDEGGDIIVPQPSAICDVVDSLIDAGFPLVVDLPRDSSIESVMAGRFTSVVLVAGMHARALADVEATAERFRTEAAGDARAELRIVTRGGRPTDELVDALVCHVGIRHAGHLPDDPKVARAAERGEWPGTRGALRRVCVDLVSERDGIREVA